MPSMTTPLTTPLPTTTTSTTTTTRRTTTPYTFTTPSTSALPITFTTPAEVWGEAINDIPVEPTGFMPEVSPMADVLKKVDPFKSPQSSRQKYQGNDGTIANFSPLLQKEIRDTVLFRFSSTPSWNWGEIAVIAVPKSLKGLNKLLHEIQCFYNDSSQETLCTNAPPTMGT